MRTLALLLPTSNGEGATIQKSLDAMNAALRVLTAISKKQAPSSQDIIELETHAGPQPDGVDLDEFACTVIMQALKRRTEARAALAQIVRLTQSP
jgi:hypothetical protein